MLNGQKIKRMLSNWINLGLKAKNVPQDMIGLTPDIKVINYQVNDFCNSKCVMCNVWNKPFKQHMNAEEFRRILRDPGLQGVEHIGITGGEPSLIRNLPDYFYGAIIELPKLEGLSLITNSLLPESVISHVREINRKCNDHGIKFSVMLSLDGMGDVHNRNRGIPGSFEKVIKVMNELRHMGIAFSTGTTITRTNVWGLDELLGYLRESGLYGRFRIAEFINRLDNNQNSDMIRSFNNDEIYQLKLFFSKLEYAYESDETIKNTYRSIKNMLSGGARMISCPYLEGTAVNIDCYGGIAYCAPKSQVIGNLQEASFLTIYQRNIGHLHSICQKYCDSCIHDYHAMARPVLMQSIEDTARWKSFFSIQSFNANKNKEKKIYSLNIKKPLQYTIFIVGWYGTETIGDKAILGGIIDRCREKYPDAAYMISSLYPFITERTVNELRINAKVVPVYSENFFQTAAIVDQVVVGGGPLMELEELSLILWAFSIAKKRKAQTTIFGSGIGPLYSKEKTNAVKDILNMADEVFLRDENSVGVAANLTDRVDITNIGDPAIHYLLQHYAPVESKKKNELACFLRELTTEYRSTMSTDEFFVFKQKFEETLAENIQRFCAQYGLVPRFYAMHNFVIGNDDRDFNFQFAKKYFVDREYYVENRLSTIDGIVKAMQTANVNLCMRFHSVVFANTLKTNYIALDYTNGGKILAYLSDVGQLKHMVTMQSIIDDPEQLCHCWVDM
ncbi:polysaccharide pyruvyl transferase family protein [Acetonema longum]|uniref:Radical SAM core domain-containing protein n=1 Tax=Acetonema longum DSM 6540 TaxID=1009370 RepID=F7NNQ9_9FIRM|nr:polysaccharide pyruvyl transferase family protein [Acetonema longum]EGO62243.1 hypothetical protein ALO_18752 [Acetonema longum DSM 6540]